MQNRFVELLLEERARGKTILLSSHVFEETERTCGRAAILRKGRLAAVEDMERLRASRSKTFCISFAREEEAARFAGTFPEAVPRGTEVELPLSAAPTGWSRLWQAMRCGIFPPAARPWKSCS